MPSPVTPFGFVGQGSYQTGSGNDGSGLQLLGNRFYDPSIGRFLSRDPIGAGDNWYAYCENNPVSFIDPLGLEDDDNDRLIIRIGGAIGEVAGAVIGMNIGGGLGAGGGTLVCPGVGTISGGVVGAAAGTVLGGGIGYIAGTGIGVGIVNIKHAVTNGGVGGGGGGEGSNNNPSEDNEPPEGHQPGKGPKLPKVKDPGLKEARHRAIGDRKIDSNHDVNTEAVKEVEEEIKETYKKTHWQRGVGRQAKW